MGLSSIDKNKSVCHGIECAEDTQTTSNVYNSAHPVIVYVHLHLQNC